MTTLQAIVLGIVQGLTEFLPVSSSGHLILVRWLFGWESLDATAEKAFDVAVHVGTLVGASAFLRADIVRVLKGLARTARTRRLGDPHARLAWLLVIATLPAVVTGALLESTITDRFGSPSMVAVALIAGAVLLFIADRLVGRRDLEDLSTRHALAIGAAQAIALQPGVSRSGATLTASLALGYRRDDAARLSFLMSLPLIGGAAAYEAVRLRGETLPRGFLTSVAIGAGTAAVTSLVAVWVVLAVVRRRSFTPFVVYRVVAGAAVLALVAFR